MEPAPFIPILLTRIEDMVKTYQIKTTTAEKAKQNFIQAAEKGIKKIMSKMGISTLNSYQGA